MNPDPIATRKPLDGFSIASMVGLCVIWGFQQVAIKISAPDMSPVLQVGIRSAGAALLVLAVMLVRRENLSLRDGTLGPGLLVGLLFGGEFLAVSMGLNYTTAGHMAVFLYTAPIFTVLGIPFLSREERMNRKQWLGAGVAFAGVAMAFSGSFFGPGGKDMLLGDALGILGGILWAATTLVIRGSRLSETPATKTLLYQLAGAGLMLPVYAWFSGKMGSVVWTPRLGANLVFQTVVVAFASYLYWFWLLRKYLASRLSVFSFLTPMFGISFGVLILKEPLDPRFVIGALLVLTGITIVNRR